MSLVDPFRLASNNFETFSTMPIRRFLRRLLEVTISAYRETRMRLYEISASASYSREVKDDCRKVHILY